MRQLTEIFNAIKNDPMNKAFTYRGIDPLYFATEQAKILIVGQAPGLIAEQTKLYWNDVSGDRLRDWLGMDRDTFYNSGDLAILPMDFYFPGKGKSGDLPPRKDFAKKWHPLLLKTMPNISLTILVGSYAVRSYLNLPPSAKLTDIIEQYASYLPNYFPLVHPSPRNQIWLKKHPWFQEKIIPKLQQLVNQTLHN